MDLNDILDDEINESFNDANELEHNTSAHKINGLSSPLSSEKSIQISLQLIREHRAGLNEHRQSILKRVPKRETFSSFKLNYIKDKDLAYLSAATGDEFALLRGKKEDILYHGTPMNCHIEKSESLMNLLKSHTVRLEIHSHPDRGVIVPSEDDRNFLKAIEQKESKIISSYTGKIITFTTNKFDDMC